MALWGTGVWDAAKWTEQVGQMAASETGVDVFTGEGDVVLSGVMAATESTTDTFAGSGEVQIVGQMAAVETGADSFAAEGTVEARGEMAATESQVDTFAGEGDVVLSGVMSAAETGVDVLSADGAVVAPGTMAAVETGMDGFAADGEVKPQPINPLVTPDVGAEKKRIKRRDEALEKYRQEQLALRKAIESAISPVTEKAAPVVVSQGRKRVDVLALDGSKVAIPVPLAFSAAEVARLVGEALERAQIEATRVMRAQDAERALQAARVELARIIKRKRDDELLLLMMD